jgi:hypothetical protein
MGFEPAEMRNSSPEKPTLAVASAMDDLAFMGLLEPQRMPDKFKLTQKGREMLQVGIPALWGPMVQQYVEPEQLQVLTKLVEMCQEDRGTHVNLVEKLLTEVGAALGPEWQDERGTRVGNVVQQLEEPPALAKIGGFIGFIAAIPKYRGIVKVTRTLDTKLQALIRSLLADGENVNVDFKQEVHLQTKAHKAEFIKDLLALVTTKARGERYMLIGFDDKTGAFVKSADPAITKDRIEDLLIAYTEPVPSIRYATTAWPGGTVGLIEVIREAHKLPYQVKVDISDKVKAGDVFVRHGSHTVRLKPSDEEYQDLVAERNRARLT